jgi:hypothetical protein
MTVRSFMALIFIATVSSMLSACMTAPTVDVTSSPFRATSDVTDGVSNATTDLTQPTQEFTSSTSPKSWFAGDGTVKAEHKVRALIVFTFANVKGEVARGSGEYLVSLATLAGVPAQRHAEFFRFVQDQYGFIYAEGIKPVESVDRLIQALTGPVSSAEPRGS